MIGWLGVCIKLKCFAQQPFGSGELLCRGRLSLRCFSFAHITCLCNWGKFAVNTPVLLSCSSFLPSALFLLIKINRVSPLVSNFSRGSAKVMMESCRLLLILLPFWKGFDDSLCDYTAEHVGNIFFLCYCGFPWTQKIDTVGVCRISMLVSQKWCSCPVLLNSQEKHIELLNFGVHSCKKCAALKRSYTITATYWFFYAHSLSFLSCCITWDKLKQLLVCRWNCLLDLLFYRFNSVFPMRKKRHYKK